MHWLLGIFTANFGIFGLEWIYRTSKFPDFSSALFGSPFFIPLILLGQFGLFWGFRGGGASSLIYAGIVFTVMNLAFRIVNTYVFIGESVSPYTWGALFLMVCATAIGALK